MTRDKKFIHVDDDDASVGYGKPPKHSRFKPGQSGNPKGRKGSGDFNNWENPIQKYMLEPVSVTVKGKKQKIPVVDALIRSAIARAMGGCTKHLKVLLDGSGGLKALIQEQKRQKSQADQEYIDRMREDLKKWLPSETFADAELIQKSSKK
jgi:hypothetical protein